MFLLSTSVAAQQEAPHNIGQLTESLHGIRRSHLDFGREGRVFSFSGLLVSRCLNLRTSCEARLLGVPNNTYSPGAFVGFWMWYPRGNWWFGLVFWDYRYP